MDRRFLFFWCCRSWCSRPTRVWIDAAAVQQRQRRQLAAAGEAKARRRRAADEDADGEAARRRSRAAPRTPAMRTPRLTRTPMQPAAEARSRRRADGVRDARLGRPRLGLPHAGDADQPGRRGAPRRARQLRGISICTTAAATSAIWNWRPTAARDCWCKPSAPARRRPRPGAGGRPAAGSGRQEADAAARRRPIWPRCCGSDQAAATSCRWSIERDGAAANADRRACAPAAGSDPARVGKRAACATASCRRDFVEPPSFLLTLQQVDDRRSIAEGDATELPGVDLHDGQLADRRTGRTRRSVTFERRVPKHGLSVTKRYELAQGRRRRRKAGSATRRRTT